MDRGQHSALPNNGNGNGHDPLVYRPSRERSRQLHQLIKWLYPGMRVKRWLGLAAAGALLAGACAASLTGASSWPVRLAAMLGVGAGVVALFAGLVRTIRSLMEAIGPIRANQSDLVDVVFHRRHLQKGMKIVVIGGGTGLSTMLQGLKAYTDNLTAIVTMVDDGGSSGRLRHDLGILPPGDIRNCLVALADTEPLMQQLFQHRFADGDGLRGHNFGNLFIAALTQITGDFEHAVQAASRVLAIRGHVIPSTYAKAQLVAEHNDGSVTVGESRIGQAAQPIRRLWLEPRDPLPAPEALSAIREAELIVIGPGSLYTSLIPNLLIPGLVDAIVQSSALRVYVCNVMTQYRETHGFTAADHVRALVTQTHPAILQVCLANAPGQVPRDLLHKYQSEDAFPVQPDVERIRALGYQVIVQDLMNTENYVRHDPHKLARELIELKLGSRPNMSSSSMDGRPRPRRTGRRRQTRSWCRAQMGGQPLEQMTMITTSPTSRPDAAARPRFEAPKQVPERRRNPRLDCGGRTKGAVGPWYAQRSWSGALLDLSATGMSLRISPNVRVTPGMTVRVSLDVPPPPAAPGRVSQPIRCDVAGTVTWTRPAAGGQGTVCGVRLFKLISEFQELSGWALQRGAVLFLVLLLAVAIIAIKTYNVFWFWYDPLFQLYSTIVAFYIISRMFFALIHKTPPDRGYLPSVSVIISVKNEEAHIAETIERCFRSRYPAHLMEIITVDDGSTDRTWTVLNRLQERHPNLKIFRFEQNKGKRHAMALGFEHSTGDALVMVDSDSYVDPEGIYRLVQGFADPRVGAIAGHTRAIVEPTNVISKMESVRYFIAHKMMKTAESVFGCVTCCPGCFSAYRRSAIMPILPTWLNQTFRGKPATFGDDRSLTNFVLRNYRVIFCDTAMCWTYVPNTWAKYFRQQLRWKKSWYRETLTACRIMHQKQPLAALFYYIGVMLTAFAPIMVVRNMVILPLFYSVSAVPYVTGIGLIYLFFCCLYFYFTRGQEWAYGMVFAGLYVGVMCWQNYYAMFTCSRPHWGTR